MGIRTRAVHRSIVRYDWRHIVANMHKTSSGLACPSASVHHAVERCHRDSRAHRLV